MNEDLTQLWMVPYADLMSTLVILFMFLFASAYSQKAPEHQRMLAQIEKDVSEGKQANDAQVRLGETEMAVKIQDEMKRLELQDFGVKITDRYVRLTLPAPVLFAEGSEKLNPRAEQVLGSLATLFAKIPNPVLVEGHTDNVRIVSGRFRSNWELSAARSFSVIEYLIGSGMPPDRFHARGYGEHRPAAGNETAVGRGKNRRIEISLIRELRKDG
ncbi:MAG: flagellar motor protein MotB [Elusimicrobia bacterium]|nr:flagellar motor protein MotB [Elusimicrobiota bacterium]